MQQRHIIVTGIPASGKTTIGQHIAAAFGLDMLDKDDILEALFNSRGVGDVQWRTRLSRIADEMLREQALKSEGAVIASWWRHPLSTVPSGTPVEWLSGLQGALIELHCVCDPRVATRRFKSRRRHEGHLDRSKPYGNLLATFQEQAALGPLGVGLLVEVNTERGVDMETLLARIASLSEAKVVHRVSPKHGS
jgi:glucokinase